MALLKAQRCWHAPPPPGHATPLRLCQWHGQWVRIGRQSVSCDTADNRSFSLKSLDSLLGTSEEEDRAAAEETVDVAPAISQAELKRLKHAGFHQLQDEVTVPTVPPAISFIFYYWQLVVYVATEYLDAVEGLGAGDDWTATLVNDHLETLQGHELVRLVTSPFVHTSPWALLIALLALGLMASELEGYLGYWAFGTICVLTAVSTGLLEAGLDEFPITQGALPVIGGLVAALLVTQSKSALFGDKVEQARKAPASGAAAALSAVQSLSPPPLPAATTTSQALQGQQGQGQGHDRQGSATEGGEGAGDGKGEKKLISEEEQKEAELEFYEGLVKINIKTSAPLKAAAGVATAAFGALQTLYDLEKGGGGVSSTWAGLFMGLAVGAVLAWGLAPAWTVDRVSWAEGQAEAGGAGGAAGPRWPLPAIPALPTDVGDKPAVNVSRYPDLLRVRDSVPLVRKVGVVAGVTGACAVFVMWATQ